METGSLMVAASSSCKAFTNSVTIYFDSNPNDGLLETHNVDKSLEGKLKSLIFIPILSQTYCDPKSFAWQHEFVAFNKLTKEDQFGRDIKLSNGNLASRILPIKIHDLDAEDKATIEKEIGGALRAIEFIYKEPGVNRPLKSTDNKTDNQNKTDYRNQVNKVANAIKEIIIAFKNPVQNPSTTIKQQSTPNHQKSKTKFILAGAIALLIIAGYFLYPKYNSVAQQEEIDKSIAVLPFVDLSQEQDMEYLGDGVAEEIINVLAQAQNLKVIARSSSFQFKGKNQDLREIGRQLGVSTILEGSVRKFKDQIRVTAQLINVADGSHYWSRNMDKKTDNLFEIQDAIAREVAEAMQLTLQSGATTQRKVKWNDESQKLYQQGRYFYDRLDDSTANDLLKRSVALDSNQAISHLYLSFNSSNLNLADSLISDLHLKKAFSLDPQLTEAHTAAALNYLQAFKFDKAWNEINIALSNGSNNPVTLRNAGRVYMAMGKSAEAVAFARKAVELDPLQTRSWNYLSEILYCDRNYSEVLRIMDQQQIDRYIRRFSCLVLLSKFKEAREEIHLIKDLEVREYFTLLLDRKSVV